MTEIPVLSTERLVLRGPTAADWPAVEAFLADDRARFVGGPLGTRDAWRRFAVLMGHWALNGFGIWAVTEKGSDACIGLVGCFRPVDWPEPELAWSLFAGAEGRGYAAEAALAARAHAYGTLGWTTVVSYIDPENARSIALAEKIGARHDPAAPRLAHAPECDVYRHPDPEKVS